MNWYQVFYWISVADGVKDFFDFTSNLFTALAIVSVNVLLIFVISLGVDYNEGSVKSKKYWITQMRRLSIFFTILAFICWSGYIFIPSKKDALIIVAGGAVGQFITSDSSAKQIPSEAMALLRSKIRSEIQDLNAKDFYGDLTDTLKEKSKEELIEMIKNNGVPNK